MTRKELETLCEENNYTHPTVLGDGTTCVISVRPYNTQILIGLTYWGYNNAY